MFVGKHCCLSIVLLINISTVYMETSSNFTCTDNSDAIEVVRHVKTNAKATKTHAKVYHTAIKKLANIRAYHSKSAATTLPTSKAPTLALLTTKSTTIPSAPKDTTATTTTKQPTTSATPATTKSTTIKTATSISARRKKLKTLKSPRKKLGFRILISPYSTNTASTPFTPYTSKYLYGGEWHLPEVDPPGSWIF